MPTSSSPTCVDAAAVAAVLAGVDPAPLRLVCYCFGEACGYGSRARGEARPGPIRIWSDLDKPVALKALRSALRPLRLPVGEGQVLALNAQEPPRTHSLQTLIQGLEACVKTIPLTPELLALDDFAVLARYDADPTPLPADRATVGSPGCTPSGAESTQLQACSRSLHRISCLVAPIQFLLLDTPETDGTCAKRWRC
ncbi:MAG: hypothetical protein RLZZ117_235 [Cyanobacteriota bacterium]|jgi:hypothetical protein